MNFKFEVGDRVVRNKNNPESNYNFNGKYGENTAKPGDVFIISSRGLSNYGVGEIIYNVEGSYIDKPNWSNMEQNFDLEKVVSWKERLK